MRTYLILKEKVLQWNQDQEIHDLLAEINADLEGATALLGNFSPEKVKALKEKTFDRQALGARDLCYERLDQLTVEILMGVR